MGIGSSFEDVLAAAQEGAEWAFSVLYRELNPRLLRYFAARVPSEAQDLASDTWLGAARQLQGFRGGEEQFRRWLFTIAHHRMVHYFRQVGRRPEGTHQVPDVSVGNVEDDALGGLTALEAARRIAEILTPDQAEVVLLRILADLSIDEVANVLGKRSGTVRVLQHRALKKLADDHFSVEAVTP